MAALEAAPDSPAAHLHRLVRHRDTLHAVLQQTWQRLPRTDPGALDHWAAAAAGLIEANAGAACHVAFWTASTAARGRLDLLAAGGRAAAAVCRRAGSRAALSLLNAMPSALDLARDANAFGRWLRGMERLAHEAGDCVPLAAAQAGALLQDRSGEAFADFVAAGLKAYAGDPVRRRAFFSLADPWARVLLARRPGVPGAAELSRLLDGFAAALWGGAMTLQAAPAAQGRTQTAILGGVALLPASVPAETPQAARHFYLAVIAHAGAHLALPPVRHQPGPLKPLQMALVTLVEDARVEALAMRRYPGLRGLWAPFHQAPASGPRTAPLLFARLARALFDPAHPDPDGFVAKGRTLFATAAEGGLDDPALSLRIGSALGHDLGQMRVQFNAREHVTAPPYRDDGAHLWDMPDHPASALDLMVQAARTRDGAGAGAGNGPAAGRARETPPDQRGQVIGTYPEWDAAAGVERLDWTTLRDVPARLADPAPLRAAAAADPALRASIRRMVRASPAGRPLRLRRQADGDGLDLDAAVDAMAALRAGKAPDPRLFTAARPRRRDLATMLLLDASASTAARLPDGRTVLDVQRTAVALLAEAMAARGDPFALRAFASDGREDVRLTRIKEFNESYDVSAVARLAGLRPSLSTRLGTALRHAQAEFGAARTWRRLLIVLTDGEPSDRDVADPADLVADARRAVLGLRASGVDVFGIVLDPGGAGSADAIFGRAGTAPVRDLADLPARLAGLYFRLARR